MKREEIVKRVDQRLDGDFHTWEDMKYEFDDAIIEINRRLHSKFPMMTDVMISNNSEYKNFIINIHGEDKPVVFIKEAEFNSFKSNLPQTVVYDEYVTDIFPVNYIRSTVVPFVVARMLQREDEYGNLQNTMLQDFETGMNDMFTNFYSQIPYYYVNEEGDIMSYSKHDHDNPFQLKGSNTGKGPLDQ